MPWKEESLMSQRKQLIEQMLLPGANIKELCSLFNVSRKTAYKWLNRYMERGLAGLSNASRTPNHQPARSSAAVENKVIEVHKANPYWGPYKLQQYLINEKLLSSAPSHQTISKILKRHGCQVISNQASASATQRFERSRPNELWQMDFKGSFMTKAQRCYPLTIIDDYSRYSIGLKACEDETRQTVKEHLVMIFEEHGLPDQINVDNGNPWGSADLESYTSLHIWLMKLGIKLSHSSPYHPQTNGKCERFHRSLKLEVLHQRLYHNLSDIQKAFDSWQHLYNFKRPHQGINNKPPMSRYQKSSKPFPSKLPAAEYDQGELVRRVSVSSGLFRFKGERYRAGKALSGELIAIRETQDPETFAIFFMDSFIKSFQVKEGL